MESTTKAKKPHNPKGRLTINPSTIESQADYARRLGVSRAAVCIMVKEKRVESVRLGGKLFVRVHLKNVRKKAKRNRKTVDATVE